MSRRVRPGAPPRRGGESCHWVSCDGRGGADGDDADGGAAVRCLRSLSWFSPPCRLAFPTNRPPWHRPCGRSCHEALTNPAKNALAARERFPVSAWTPERWSSLTATLAGVSPKKRKSRKPKTHRQGLSGNPQRRAQQLQERSARSQTTIGQLPEPLADPDRALLRELAYRLAGGAPDAPLWRESHE